MSKTYDDYRVICHDPKVKGLESAFSKFSTFDDARCWAISYGKKMLADSIEFARKSRNRFNHYVTLEIIQINTL